MEAETICENASMRGLTRKLTSAEQLIAAGVEASRERRKKEAMHYFDQAHHLQVSWLKGMAVNLNTQPVSINNYARMKRLSIDNILILSLLY